MLSCTQDDTIVAIATPLGSGGVGIVRLSGPASLAIAKRCCKGKQVWIERMATLRTICHPKTEQTLDEGCVIYFKAPRSYTGEDVVEFQVHSGPQVLQSLVQACESAGARLAEPGEYTRRAFFNGKIDLTKAEAIIDLTEATNPFAQRMALSHLEGKLLEQIIAIRDRLMHTLEQLEGSIDFPDEVPEIEHDSFMSDLKEIRMQLDKVLKTQDFGEAIRSGVKVVIVGQPNVGKSSLMNCLLGKERAIVTPIPGTTRDYIEGQFLFSGLTFHLYDTAGLRNDSNDVIEQLGMKKIQDLIQKAHLILWVIDGSQKETAQDLSILRQINHDVPICCVINKSDKNPVYDLKTLPKHLPKISCHTQSLEGLEKLKHYLQEDVVSLIQGADLEWMCNLRQQSVLGRLLVHVDELILTLSDGFEDDMLAIDLKKAVLACHEITGEEVTEEVLDGIFNRFCVGK